MEQGEPLGLPADQLGRQLGVAPLLRQRRRSLVRLEVGEGEPRLRRFGPGVRQPQALHAGTEGGDQRDCPEQRCGPVGEQERDNAHACLVLS